MSQTKLFTIILNVGYGTNLAFGKSDQPFTPYQYGTVIYNKIYDSNSQIFIFNKSNNVNINDSVVISDTPKLTITNFTIENNRARGIRLETRNILVEKCIFNRTSGPAILFQPSLTWHMKVHLLLILHLNEIYLLIITKEYQKLKVLLPFYLIQSNY